jgi:hypothetical protein
VANFLRATIRSHYSLKLLASGLVSTDNRPDNRIGLDYSSGSRPDGRDAHKNGWGMFISHSGYFGNDAA